jgi:hypothetical protein
MKQLLLILAGLTVISTLYAQRDSSRNLFPEENSRVSLGFRAGPQLSSLIGSDLRLLSTGGQLRAITGYFAAININTRISTCFSLNSELGVSRTGASLNLQDSASGRQFDSKFRSLYLTIQPASPTLTFKRLRLYAGPYLSLLMSASIQRLDDKGSLYTDKSIFGNATSPGAYRHKLDIGLAAGLEYELKNGVSFGAGWRRGFVPVMEDTRVQQQWKIYNQQFLLTLGIRF